MLEVVKVITLHLHEIPNRSLYLFKTLGKILIFYSYTFCLIGIVAGNLQYLVNNIDVNKTDELRIKVVNLKLHILLWRCAVKPEKYPRKDLSLLLFSKNSEEINILRKMCYVYDFFWGEGGV